MRCPNGLPSVALGTTVQTCQIGVQTCPQGSTCMATVTTSPVITNFNGVCCVGTPQCPSGLQPSTATATVCTTPGQCPGGFVAFAYEN